MNHIHFELGHIIKDCEKQTDLDIMTQNQYFRLIVSKMFYKFGKRKDILLPNILLMFGKRTKKERLTL